MRMLLTSSLALSISIAFTFGCATSSGGEGGGGGGGGFGVVDTEQFPTRDQLAEVAAKELPALKANVHSDVASWTLKGPMPNRFGHAALTATPGAVSGLNDVLLATLPATSSSENMDCAARELAELMVQNDMQQPEGRLKSWILVRCGVTAGDVGAQWLSWPKVPEKMLDGAIWKDSKDEIAKMLEARRGKGHVGIAFARNTKKHTAMVLVVNSDRAPKASVEAGSQVVAADSASVVVAGALTQPAEVIYAYATKGLLEAAECTLDLSVVLPRFRFTCPVDAADASARIDVGMRQKGRVLGESVANLLVVRDAAATAAYQEAKYADFAGAAGAVGAVGAAPAPGELDVLGAINRVRASAGQAPLKNVSAQSEQVKKVAPHYFANLMAEDNDPEISDVVALGLLAGWDVTEMTIHDAGFATLLDVSGGGDDLLGYALDHPMPRAVLLDPKMSAAAIGPATLEGGMKGALVITYEALVPPDHKKAAADVFEKLRAVRKQRGLGVTGSIPTEELMLDAAQELQAGGDIEQVAHAALDKSVEIMGRPFTIWMMEVHDTDHIAFPDQLLTARTTYVAISVATRKRPKSAWGSTIVLVLGFVDDARVASLSPAHNDGHSDASVSGVARSTR